MPGMYKKGLRSKKDLGRPGVRKKKKNVPQEEDL